MEMQLQDALTFIGPPLVSAISLAAMHWFPGALRQTPVARYVQGTLITVGVPVAAMLLTAAGGLTYGSLFWAALLIANTAVSGAAVAGAYWIDRTRPVSLEDVSDAARRS